MIELWGGCECTVNRVGDVFHDQTLFSGHHDRLEDLDRFARLGLKTLRYPLLWERVGGSKTPDWSWTDARMARAESLGLNVIAGLLHHGSGPPGTHLLDEAFPERFAAFARAVATRYPSITDWIPINEPLTTARFSMLYGHWHPHLSDEAAFWSALLNQIDATRLAVREIRSMRPAARFIQTEDLGCTYATPAVAHQADYDNARRWMTWDLLFGHVVEGHWLYRRLVAFGFDARLRMIADDPCPPDLLGVNHYLTSDRFLDHRIEDYPPDRVGGNESMRFADVEAIRVLVPSPGGLRGALEETWTRYHRPIAVTECHNGCTREEQVRWLREAWDTAHELRDRGVEVQAVTAWALLGARNWSSLLTDRSGGFESGAFDVRFDPPRPTAIAHEIARMAGGDAPAHPATLGEGWWRRDIRLQYRPVLRAAVRADDPPSARRGVVRQRRPLLILGASGTLGRAFARACDWRGLDYRLTDRTQLPLGDESAIAGWLDRVKPWAVVNAAGWVRVDEAESAPEACMEANAYGAVRLAHACHGCGVPLATFSSDLVFDGTARRPYVESDAPAPLNVYGASKAHAEREILALRGRALVVRTAAFFSPFDAHNFASHVVGALAAGRPFRADQDAMVSPTFVPDLVDAVLDLLIDGDVGLQHLANAGALSWAEFARRIAQSLALPSSLVDSVSTQELDLPARRPAYSVLGSERARLLPELDSAVARYAAAMAERGACVAATRLNVQDIPSRRAYAVPVPANGI